MTAAGYWQLVQPRPMGTIGSTPEAHIAQQAVWIAARGSSEDGADLWAGRMENW